MFFLKTALRLLAAGLFFLASPIFAQEIRWELVDTGVLNHSMHGKGIEMRIKPDPMPENLFDSAELPEIMAALCNHYAPSVIPFVQEQTGLETADFISVRLVSGGAVFGRYVLQAYSLSEGQCGGEL